MPKYAVLVKHFARDLDDIRVEIVNVPRELEHIGPHEAMAMVRENLLGPFEVICVTDRIQELEYKRPETASATERSGGEK